MAKKINTFYWRSADVKAREVLLNLSIEETEAEIIKQYTKSSQRIIAELTSIYDDIQQMGDNVQISALYNYDRYYKALADTQKRLKKLGVKEDKILTENLESLYKQVQAQISEEFNMPYVVNEEAVKQAVTSVWVDDGLRFSDRIYSNKTQLLERLEETLVDGIQTGKSTEKLAKKLAEDCSIGINESRRLVRTELSHCQIKGTIDKYKDAGVKQYRWLTASGCCGDCSDKDGKVFSVEADELPPAHPNCRCTILAVID